MAKSQYFDSHAHLTDAPSAELEDILQRARDSGVTSILNICTTAQSLERGIALAATHPWICNAAATPPHTAFEEGEAAFPFFAQAARKGQLAALGETGLDYHHCLPTKEAQKQWLKEYFRLAQETALPLIFHCREAFSDLFSLADALYPKKAPAVLHCFTGTMEEARGVIERGWYLSISGIVTFKKSESLRAVAKWIPLSHLLIETDTPFLAPQTRRGAPNEPSFLPETAACIAEVKQISIEEVARATRENAAQIFSIAQGS